MDRIAYTLPEAARIAGVSRTRIFEAVRKQELTIRKAGRASIVTHDDLVAWVKKPQVFHENSPPAHSYCYRSWGRCNRPGWMFKPQGRPIRIPFGGASKRWSNSAGGLLGRFQSPQDDVKLALEHASCRALIGLRPANVRSVGRAGIPRGRQRKSCWEKMQAFPGSRHHYLLFGRSVEL
jgi:hypothetical protein